MKILIYTDLEGVSGIVEWDKGKKASPQEKAYQQYLMTNEVNGAVEGALKAGAKEVWVADGHGGGSGNLSNVDTLQLHPEAILYKGTEGPGPVSAGMKKGMWDAMAFIGNHAMAGTKNGVLTHTQDLNIAKIYFNKLLVGEFGTWALFAGDLNLPVVLVSGDNEACKQAKKLIPNIETAVVKYSLGMHSAWCLSPKKARELIATKIEKAIKNRKKVKPLVSKKPVTLRVEMKDGSVNITKAKNAIEAFHKFHVKLYGV
jgi:D-amino peptidase